MPDYQPITHKHTTYVNDEDFVQDSIEQVAAGEDISTIKHWSMAVDEQEALALAATHLDTEPPIDSGPAYTEDVLVTDFWDQEAANDNLMVESPGVNVTLHWELLPNVTSHSDLQEDLQFQTFKEFEPLSELRLFTWLAWRVIFTARELCMMNSPTAWINDGCINGIGSLLMDHFSESTRTMSMYS
ncbi:hypothetical protein DXG01_000455 [Tephrocybe rancida]|nr:hypothetical protein DXG01_000455 [Tephrocybe rancida]